MGRMAELDMEREDTSADDAECYYTALSQDLAFVRWLDDIEAQNEPETNSGYHSERLGR